jgi:uncharacterized membrane protein YkvA (DUF1232 family)
MSEFFGFLSTFLMCGTILTIAFMIVLSLPKSHMRDVMKKVLFAVGCVFYIVSPIDLMPEALLGPFGLIDDAGALGAALLAAHSALRSMRGGA